MFSSRQMLVGQLESALVADCGSNVTRVVLIEIVDNAYRFIARGEAPSTSEAPFMDVTVGVMNAIASIEASTGRKLISDGRILIPQEDDRTGVDAFLASSSAAEPLRLVAAGLVKNESAAAAARGSHSTYTTVLDTISLDDYGDDFDSATGFTTVEIDFDNPEAEFNPFKGSTSRPPIFGSGQEALASKRTKKKQKGISLAGDRTLRHWRERQIAKLRRLSPNFIVMSGGVDSSSYQPLLALLDVVLEANRQEAVLAMATGVDHKAPTLIFAGNSKAHDALMGKMSGQLESFLVDNIKPSYDRENLEPLQNQLSLLYQERLLPGLPGYQKLAQLSSGQVNTTCRAVGLMTRYLAHQIAGNKVLTADIGGNNTSLFYATAGEFNSMVQGDFGLSYGLSNVLAQTGVVRILRWIPFNITEDEVIHYALNKTLRPNSIPADERERYIEAAFAREALRCNYIMLSKQSSKGLDYNRIIGVGGPLVNVTPWHAVLMLLDAFEPAGSDGTGLLDIELDTTMLMSTAGTLATYNPNAAAYLFQYDCLNRLGSVVVPLGHASPGSLAVTVSLHTRSGRTRQLKVKYGDIEIIPFYSDEEATLEIIPAPGFRIGSAAAGVPIRSQEFINGGSVGLVIDARGRPLHFPSNSDERQELVAHWYSAYRNALQRAEQDNQGGYSLQALNNSKAPPSQPVAELKALPEKEPVKVAPTPKPIAKTKPQKTFKPAKKKTVEPTSLSELTPEELLRKELTGKGKKKR
ncbi:glutamate mutase L [Candidatus Chlorohelix sp.]|uniref:glutamate mutase L n=1 Tax=Candidatus Chlorohelix sp. TaxID=3139201 RepID=UPI00305A623A